MASNPIQSEVGAILCQTYKHGMKMSAIQIFRNKTVLALHITIRKTFL